MPCIKAATSVLVKTRIFSRGTRRQILPKRTFLYFLLLLLLPSVSPIAEPKGFTEDPYVDDEKFREKGWLCLYVIIIIIIIIIIMITILIISVRSSETEEGESVPASMSAVLDQKNYIEELNRHLK